jgi:hypothetical protein
MCLLLSPVLVNYYFPKVSSDQYSVLRQWHGVLNISNTPCHCRSTINISNTPCHCRSTINISNTPCHCHIYRASTMAWCIRYIYRASTMTWCIIYIYRLNLEFQIPKLVLKRRKYHIQCAWRVSCITFTRYFQNWKTWKPNNLTC